ncbi:nonsense-mediated mRNA decay factor SMG5 [Patella vulgata]|uniref:nonsense-mediated mRNA decay factor SMG5 n=1 Tax=Patella vulgata TaxID=6465 RepID=UPI00217FB0F1|nr:nonsense-mediated mRNA decay factor SMG5 [Patella vulgata]
MKKSSSAGNETKPDVDKAKKVYKYALDAIRKLDDITKQKKAYRDVFSQESVGLRNKLKEYCERLMFYNPGEYGRKAEEVLWRKVFYDIIQVIKHNRKHLRPHSSLQTAYRSHLASAWGYYQHLLFKLQQEYSLNLAGILDFHIVADSKFAKKSSSPNSKKISQNVQDWALKACHRCLICLGDIARYQQDFDHGVSCSIAERYYYQALILLPEQGMPHNQLGTLSGSRYFNAEAAYHYIRCLSSDKPFEGAVGNLKRLFEKNSKRYEELSDFKNTDLGPEEKRHKDIRRFFIRFVHLLEILHETSKHVENSEMQVCCQDTLQNFDRCMFYEPGVSMSEDNVSLEQLQYLDDDMVFKVVVTCISSIHLLQQNGSRQVAAGIAYLLAIFSHILNHVVIRLQAAFYDKENPNRLLQNSFIDEDSSSGDCDQVETHSGSIDHQRDTDNSLPTTTTHEKTSDSKKKSKGRSRHIRRRRRRKDSDSSEMSDLSEASDLSEGINEEHFMSDESEDDLVSYFDHDSDSDLSEGMMNSQEIKQDIAGKKEGDNSNHKIDMANSNINHNNTAWIDSAPDNLAHFSSKLFSASTFLGQNLDTSKGSSQFEIDKADYENCKDIIQGKKDVSVPPGFVSSDEAKHVADITHKLANFVIETDTEVSLIPTDTDTGYTLTETETEPAENSSTTSNDDKPEADHQRLQNLLDVIHNEGLLPTVKIMCDWMKCHTHIIDTCAQSSQSLWCRLSVLLNFLPVETDLIQHDQCWLEELQIVLQDIYSQDWKQEFPLKEDFNLCHLPPLVDVHAGMKFTMKTRSALTEIQETFLRIACLRQFGHFLSSIDSLEFSYKAEEAMFIGPTQVTNEEETEKAAQDRMRDDDRRRNQLMKDMAQLRLQAEVNQLEGSLQSADQPTFPPYLIPDTSVLCNSLASIKQLTQQGRSIVIIPLSVIDSLDYIKKENSGSREAIRWLEIEFKKGNRYIRAQKSSETAPVSNVRMLKKKKRDLWCILELAVCAQYFAQQTGCISGGNLVTVLTSQPFTIDNLSTPIQQVLSTTQQQGVSFENIKEFTTKWKDMFKNKG